MILLARNNILKEKDQVERFYNKTKFDPKIYSHNLLNSGLPMVWGKFSTGFQNFLQGFKGTHFWVYF